MHEIERFGGTRIYPDNCSKGIVCVQFESRDRLDAWKRMMRNHYNTDQFQSYTNYTDLTVRY